MCSLLLLDGRASLAHERGKRVPERMELCCSHALLTNASKGSHANNMTSRTLTYHMTWADDDQSRSGYFSESPKSLQI
jgi:hypothetical protein